MEPEEKERISHGLLEAEKLLLGKPRELVRELHIQKHETGVLVFQTDRGRVRQVSPKLLRVLQECLSEALKRPVEVRIHSFDSSPAKKEFYLDPSNQAVHLLLGGLAKDPKPPIEGMNPIVIHGPPGVGKTSFLRRFIEDLEHPVAFWNAEAFIAQIIRRAYKGGLERFRQVLIESKILLLDEVHRLRKKKRCQQELSKIMDEMRSRGNLILLASRHHPMKIHEFKSSLASRFLGGFVLELAAPQRETLLRALADRGIRGTQAETLLGKLGKAPTMGRLFDEIERNLVGSLGAGPTQEDEKDRFLRPFEMGGWDLDRLRDRVLEEFQVSLDEFLGPRRPRHVSTARQVVAYLYRRGGINSSQTARHLGWFSSASVRNAVHKVEERMAKDAEFRKMVEGCMHA
jgi:chromosomal replication initiator protein